MTTGKKNLTQKQILADKLIAINKEVTTEDRQAYCNDENASVGYDSLSKYLTGTVHSVTTGLEILRYMTKRIATRQAAILNT